MKTPLKTWVMSNLVELGIVFTVIPVIILLVVNLGA